MPNVLIQEQTLKNIADSIRAKSGKTDLMLPSQMSDEITNLPSGGVENLDAVLTEQEELIATLQATLADKAANIKPTETLEITENGTHDVTNYASAEVNVPVGIFPEGTLEITENGTYDVSTYASANVSVGGSGDETAIVDSIIDGSITELTSNAVNLRDSMFANYTKLKSVNFTNAVGASQKCFQGCSSLISANFPRAVSMGQHAFNNCTSLVNVNIPTLVSMNQYAFLGCSSLKSIDFPKLYTGIGTSSFKGCTALKDVNIPLVPSLGSLSFEECTSLEYIDLPVATTIGTAFYNCSSLKTLILRADRIVTMTSSKALTGTAIESGNGFVYVPKKWLSDTDTTSDYRQATNWVGFTNMQFRALEDYTVDGTVTGELDLTKI